MALLDLGFEWARDPAGYRVLEAEPTKPAEKVRAFNPLFGREMEMETTLLERAGRGARIVPKGDDRRLDRPLVVYPNLYAEFSKVRTAADLVAFANKFGALTAAGNDPHVGDDVAPLLRHAARMAQVWQASYSAKRRLPAAIGDGIPLTSIMSRLDVALVYDRPNRQPKVRFAVPSLLTGLWLQLAQDLAGGRIVRTCRLCGVAFDAGPGSTPHRRADAKFCSDEHRIKFNSIQRSK